MIGSHSLLQKPRKADHDVDTATLKGNPGAFRLKSGLLGLWPEAEAPKARF
jgi:hypothetical protein